MCTQPAYHRHVMEFAADEAANRPFGLLVMIRQTSHGLGRGCLSLMVNFTSHMSPSG
jgi:hypothetical protein